MSLHQSLKTPGGGIQKKRSVLKRWERVNELKKQNKLDDKTFVQHLPKTLPPV